MLVIVSPAKKLDFETSSPISDFVEPKFIEKSKELIRDLRKCSPAEVSKMMKLSEALTDLNVQRYKSFKTPFTPKNAKQAIFSFKGDTYVGFDAETLSAPQIKYAQKHMRILSGLYGVLSPLELIQPYRLEMGTKFSCNGSKNLYEFWKSDLTSELNSILKKEKVLVNCASTEYSGAVNFSAIDGRVVTPVFKDKKNDQYKIISFFAKKARGMMARYIVENKVTEVEDLKNFGSDGYAFSESMSSENEFVFTRG
ncbi:peroxide stress protein YaaA [Halobacteriovorax sp. JY17]|uniref:peroxide stress protein YaaA n=1 Tax=Halobacteriovorax sp. JY17 TaxID=2014617 RepID=UPI000C6955F0|nr:peroxide stress protein YaaA [Halobacteriovorax sp. JY17]PIK15796.1 MAG: peroxide stress protein YaaA [Halobacteriovorax sp. JY17]